MPRRPRISGKRKKQIASNVTGQKGDYYAPDIAAAQAEIPGIRRGGKREKDSIRGASSLAAKTVRGVSLKGLTGQYRRDLKRSRNATAKAIEGSVPFSTAAVNQETRDEIDSARDAVQSLQLQKERAIKTAIASKISAARTDKAQHLEDKQEKNQDAKELQAENSRAIKKAVAEIRYYVKRGGKPESQAEKNELAERVAATEGIDVDPQQARRIVEAMFSGRRRIELQQSTSPRIRRQIALRGG